VMLRAFVSFLETRIMFIVAPQSQPYAGA
jgi:hypothetical protein